MLLLAFHIHMYLYNSAEVDGVPITTKLLAMIDNNYYYIGKAISNFNRKAIN